MEICLEHQLKNGLKVLLIPTHHSPVVALQAWVQYGAADEIDEEAGLAHFFEHLLFKGTKKRKVGEIARDVESVGGDINAFTSHDHTVVHMTLGKEFLEKGLDILSDMLINTQLDPVEVDREREVVLEEMKRRLDNPSAIAGELLRERLFNKHPYGRPVIGFPEIIRNISVDHIQQAYRERYISNNMFLVIAGDFQPPETLKKVEEYFSQLVKKESFVSRTRSTSYGKQDRFFFQAHQTENLISHLAWPGLSIHDEDVAALDVLSLIYGQNESSRLIKKLVHDEKLVDSISMSSWTPKNAGVIDISFRAQPKAISKLPKILKSIQEAFHSPLETDEIERAKKSLYSSVIYSKESVDGLAQRFASLQSISGSWRDEHKYFEKLKTIDRQHLLEVQEKYIDFNNFIAAGVYPEDAKEKPKDFRNSIKKVQAPKKTVEPIDTQSISSWQYKGVTVIHRKLSHIPLVSLRWVGLGGQRIENLQKAGLGSLWSKVVDTGTENFRGKKIMRHDINKFLDHKSASIGSFHGRNSWGWQLDGLSEDFEELFEMLVALKYFPSFNAHEFHLEKNYQKQQIRSSKDTASARLYSLFHKNIFPKHPYSFPGNGYLETVNRVEQKDLINYHKKSESFKQVICVVGDIEKADLIKILDKYLGDHKNLSSKNSLIKKIKYPALKKNLFIEEKAEKKQSHLLLGFPTKGMFDKLHLARTALSALLSGQGGRLFLELRDKLSLCYSVGPTMLDGIDGGYFGFYIGTSPEKEASAIKAMWSEIEKLKSKAPSEDEWARSQAFYSGHHEIEQQYFASQCLGMALDELYGNGYQHYLNFIERFSKITPKLIHQAANEIFNQVYVQARVGK